MADPATDLRQSSIREPAVWAVKRPRSEHLRVLLFRPSLWSKLGPQDRVEALLGRELASFLIAALSESQGRLGSSSP